MTDLVKDFKEFITRGNVVKPLNALAERRRRGAEPVAEEELSDEAALLREIRDLLRAQSR